MCAGNCVNDLVAIRRKLLKCCEGCRVAVEHALDILRSFGDGLYIATANIPIAMQTLLSDNVMRP